MNGCYNFVDAVPIIMVWSQSLKGNRRNGGLFVTKYFIIFISEHLLYL